MKEGNERKYLHCTRSLNRAALAQRQNFLDSAQTDLGNDRFCVSEHRHQQTGYLFSFIFSYDIISFQIMPPIISVDAISTRAAHGSTFSTDISIQRKAKGRDFITEAPFGLLARCSEVPVVASHFLWMRIYWSIQPSRRYSTLFPSGTYTTFYHKCYEGVQLIMQFLISFFLASSRPAFIQNTWKSWRLPAACLTLAYFCPTHILLTNRIDTKIERYSNLCYYQKGRWY